MKKLFIGLLTLLVIVLSGCSSYETGTPTFTPVTTPTKTPVSISTPSPSPTPQYDFTEYRPGQYKVAVDIPAGEYMVVALSDSGYFCVSSDANGDDIIQNDIFDTTSIITIDEGQYFELSGASAVPFDEFPDLFSDANVLIEGMYKIGYHLPAGEYKIEAESGESGYYCIYPDSYQQDIISNDNFEGSRYISVQDGQYLVLVDCNLYK